MAVISLNMGFLLVFFHHPDEESNRKKPPLISPLKSSTNLLLSKTQSTLSICGILVFTTFLLFTLSTFEPSSSSLHNRDNHRHYRRILRQDSDAGARNFSPALQGMGVLFRRGSKAMGDLVVGHVAEDAEEREIATFVRMIHHSGLLSRSDLVLIFESPSSANRLGRVVKSECESFIKLVHLVRDRNFSSPSPSRRPSSGLTRYLKEVGENDKVALWGKKRNNSVNSGLTQSSQASYGSVVGFDVSELDPENSLSGFLDRVPISLRRWACYPMLLGRIRRHFKHTMLIDVVNSVIISDPFTQIRNRSSELVVFYNAGESTDSTRHGRRNSGKTRNPDGVNSVNPRVMLGGSRGVRRVANAALTEIVRVVIEHKGKGGRNSATESGLVNQLVHKGHLLKNVNVVTVTEPIPDASALVGFNSLDSSRSGFLAFSEYFSVVQRGPSGTSNVGIIDSVIRREICASHELYSSVYRDCLVG